MLEGCRDTALGDAGTHPIGRSLDRIGRVAHGHAHVDRLEEGQVVLGVADAIRGARLVSQRLEHRLHARTLAGLGRGRLPDPAGGVHERVVTQNLRCGEQGLGAAGVHADLADGQVGHDHAQGGEVGNRADVRSQRGVGTNRHALVLGLDHDVVGDLEQEAQQPLEALCGDAVLEEHATAQRGAGTGHGDHARMGNGEDLGVDARPRPSGAPEAEAARLRERVECLDVHRRRGHADATHVALRSVRSGRAWREGVVEVDEDDGLAWHWCLR